MGVFANPTSKASPAKLRVAFEVGLACECARRHPQNLMRGAPAVCSGTQVAPFAMLVEKAGGKTSDGVTGGSCLDIKIEAVDQVTSRSCLLITRCAEVAAGGRAARGGEWAKGSLVTSSWRLNSPIILRG